MIGISQHISNMSRRRRSVLSLSSRTSQDALVGSAAQHLPVVLLLVLSSLIVSSLVSHASAFQIIPFAVVSPVVSSSTLPSSRCHSKTDQQHSRARTTTATKTTRRSRHSTDRLSATTSSSSFSASSNKSKYDNNPNPTPSNENQKKFRHAMAILAMPYTSIDKIANEAILETIVPRTEKLSVVLRCEGTRRPSVASLRRYVGEVYSQLWDVTMNSNTVTGSGFSGSDGSPDGINLNLAPQSPDVQDVVVYPANLPNAAPEGWITIQPDLDCICSHDTFIGWTSEAASGVGLSYQKLEGKGRGGLAEHVDALNRERKRRKLQPLTALHVDRWPTAAVDNNDGEDSTGRVIFVDDDEGEECLLTDLERSYDDFTMTFGGSKDTNGDTSAQPENEGADPDDLALAGFNGGELLLGGAASVSPTQLFDFVAVGGTFDGLHFGHRKLLTLAVSSVNPFTGRLLVGVTADEMLQKKKFAEFIPTLAERKKSVEYFLSRLAPGMMNRIKIVPIEDKFGPPGSIPNFDALVLSHETLETGKELNQYRVSKGMKPLTLLCTRRTEAHGMCSTTIRRLRFERHQQQQQQQKNKK